MANKNERDITKKPYAQWLQQALYDILPLPVRGVALIGITENGESYVNYYNCTMADKLLISGLVNQDATLDMLAAQGVIQYEDEEEDANGEEEE